MRQSGAYVIDMNAQHRPRNTYDVMLAPAPYKTGPQAWSPYIVESFSTSDGDDQVVRTIAIVLQRHLHDLDDDDLVNVVLQDGTSFYPSPQPVSEFRIKRSIPR